MSFIVQGAKEAFGHVVQGELAREDCRQLDIAVAWVRATGLMHIEEQFLALLGRGAAVRVVVGLDGDNTSEEGLRGLVGLAASAPAGQCQMFVRHNEAGPIFHPKMYAFRTDDECRVFVGSNNLTQAGLFQNEELMILQSSARGSAIEQHLDAYMAGLVDVADGLVQPLTAEFLGRLVTEGYVQKEATLRGKLAARQRAARRKTALFGSKNVRAPKVQPRAGPVPTQDLEPLGLPVSDGWQVLYLRVRLARGQQAQIPIPVVREMRRRIGLGYSDGTVDLLSRADGTPHTISPTRAERGGGKVNTYKFEAVQVEGDTLLRIYLVGKQLYYEFLGGADPLGAPVLALLQEGFESDPPHTTSTRPADLESGTWYRFD